MIPWRNWKTHKDYLAVARTGVGESSNQKPGMKYRVQVRILPGSLRMECYASGGSGYNELAEMGETIEPI